MGYNATPIGFMALNETQPTQKTRNLEWLARQLKGSLELGSVHWF